MERRPPLLLTVGEPAGIGPDCIIRAWRADPSQFTNTIVVCPPNWLADRAEQIGMTLPVCTIASLQDETNKGSIVCWNPVNEPPAEIVAGKPTKRTAHMAMTCIREAALACIRGNGRALVTGPIEKATLREAGFAFPGHTEFLADIGSTPHVVMMLAGSILRVALLTTHMALKDVPSALSYDSTLRAIHTTEAGLRQHFGIATPRLGLCGLNPHAGERGHFGQEEIDILAPAAKTARQQGIDIEGPLPADTLFSAHMRSQFDAIISCYHDQALIPIKALEFGNAVNVTLGLPFVRTSVDHGTALTRAGTDQVSYSSLMNAIRMARAMSQEATNAAK